MKEYHHARLSAAPASSRAPSRHLSGSVPAAEAAEPSRAQPPSVPLVTYRERIHFYRRRRTRRLRADRLVYSNWEMAGPLSVVATPAVLMLLVAWAHYPNGAS